MPVIGTRPSDKRNNGKGYLKDPMCKLTESFLNVAQDIVNENSVDMFRHPDMALMRGTASRDAMKNFFCKNSCDRSSMDPEEYDDHMEMMSEQFENDCDGLSSFNEYASMNTFNPVIGMMFPIHKNLLMNCIFDKGAIPKVVMKSPKETVTMETRWLVTPKGEKIDLYRDQRKISDAVQSTNPFVEVPVILPETGTTDVLAAIGGSSLDNLSIETSISAIMVAEDPAHKLADASSEEDKKAALEAGTWIDVDMQFVTSYMDYDRSVIDHVTYDDGKGTVKTICISATMKDNKFQVVDMQGNALAVKIKARLDSSNAMLDTCKVEWSARTDLIEVGPGIPINVPISPEEVKDIGALYQVNQLTKIMSMIKLVMENTKDDDIKGYLDQNFNTMPKTDKIHRVFDFAPREGYMLDHVEWRHKTFLDALDTYVTDMLTVLNDPNMTVTIFGRPDIIRKITPTEYSYQSPNSIGPVELEFNKTIMTSDKRVYQFMSSTKLNGSNELIIILCPRNSDRIIYRIYDYQMYVSNEIRNAANPSLPAVHAFQRYKVWSYQPVQGRVTILNPTGLKGAYDSLGFSGV